MKQIPRKDWEQCTQCPNVGRYGPEDGDIEFEQVQCEFCWTNPNSVFNQEFLKSNNDLHANRSSESSKSHDGSETESEHKAWGKYRKQQREHGEDCGCESCENLWNALPCFCESCKGKSNMEH